MIKDNNNYILTCISDNNIDEIKDIISMLKDRNLNVEYFDFLDKNIMKMVLFNKYCYAKENYTIAYNDITKKYGNVITSPDVINDEDMLLIFKDNIFDMLYQSKKFCEYESLMSYDIGIKFIDDAKMKLISDEYELSRGKK